VEIEAKDFLIAELKGVVERVDHENESLKAKVLQLERDLTDNNLNDLIEKL